MLKKLGCAAVLAGVLMAAGPAAAHGWGGHHHGGWGWGGHHHHWHGGGWGWGRRPLGWGGGYGGHTGPCWRWWYGRWHWVC